MAQINNSTSILLRSRIREIEVYIFDEATSALDMATERKFMSAVFEHDPGATKIIIVHRLTAIIDADGIIVMHNGKIVEMGYHRLLTGANGLYASLWQEQTFEDKLNGVVPKKITKLAGVKEL